MKKILFLFLILPSLGFSQSNLNELKFLADNKNDVNLQFIKKKGFVYREEKDIGDGTKKLIYEKNDFSNSLIVMRVDKKGENLITYVPAAQSLPRWRERPARAGRVKKTSQLRCFFLS